MNAIMTMEISEGLDLAVRVGLMVGLYVLALRVLVAFIRPGGNVNRIMGLSVGGVMAIVAAQSYTRAYDGTNDLVSLGVLLGGLVLNIVILNKMYEVKS